MGGGGGGGGGGNEFSLAGSLTSGSSYTLYWYSDGDDNGMCDMATDNHWSEAIPSVSAAVTVTHQHDSALGTGDCTRF